MAVDVTRRALLEEGIRRLRGAAIEDPRRNAEWLLCEVLGCSRAELYAHPEAVVRTLEQMLFASFVQRRLDHEPLQYIIGNTDFFGLRLSVSPAVLIPRPETEQVVERALQLLLTLRGPRILDVGTGSGSIALALKHERPDAKVWACDVSIDALRVACSNAVANSVEVDFFEADVFSPDFVQIAPGNLDLLISNPPYVPQSERGTLAAEVRDYEPEIAVFAGDDPLVFYHSVAAAGNNLLRSSGWIVFETHAETGLLAKEVLISEGFANVALTEDYAGYPRILYGRRGE